MARGSVIQIFLMMASVIGLACGGWFHIKKDWLRNCDYQGYAPGGKVKDIGKIKAPTAKLFAGGISSVLGDAATHAGTASAVVGAGGEFVQKASDVAPKLGAALGLFGAAFGYLNTLGEPGLTDLLESVNLALEDLTKEVNDKFEKMAGYVDSRVINSEKDTLSKHYRAAFRLWSNCVREHTKAKADECQLDAVKELVADRPKYANYDSKVKEMKPLTSYERRKLEASLLLFRDYANLVILELSPLIDEFCGSRTRLGRARCKYASEDMHKEVTWFIKYVENAVKLIKQGHGKYGACLNTIQCGGIAKIVEGWPGVHTGNGFTCSCVIEDSNSKQHCKVRGTQRVDGKNHGFQTWMWAGVDTNSAAARRWSSIFLKQAAEAYQKDNGEVLSKYWEENVLNQIPVWKKAVKKAEQGLAQSDEGDTEEMEMDSYDFPSLSWHRFSDQFIARKQKVAEF